MRTFSGLIVMLFIGLTSACTRNNPSTPQAERVVVKDLQRFDVTQGNGKLAEPGKKAEIHQVIMTARGKVIQSRREDGNPEQVVVKDDSARDSIGSHVQGMKEGGKRRVTIPWGKRYGNEHESGEPLVMEIDLVKVH